MPRPVDFPIIGIGASAGGTFCFGRTAEFRRRMADDRQIREGLALLRRAKSPQDLLALGTAHPAAAPHN